LVSHFKGITQRVLKDRVLRRILESKEDIAGGW
jgi:hypothetical protein